MASRKSLNVAWHWVCVMCRCIRRDEVQLDARSASNSSPSAAMKRATASRCASIPKSDLPCLSVVGQPLAAAYTAGIVKNHPFVNGDKRAGFVLGILFLEMNGMRFTASEEAATQAVLDLAAGNMDMAGYAAFLRENVAHE